MAFVRVGPSRYPNLNYAIAVDEERAGGVIVRLTAEHLDILRDLHLNSPEAEAALAAIRERDDKDRRRRDDR